MLAEGQSFTLFAIFANKLNSSDSVCKFQRSLKRVSQTAINVISANQTVNNDVNRVILVSGQLFT